MKIETKYDIGDAVWVEFIGEPEHCRIEAITSYRSRTHRYVEYYVVPINSNWGFHEKEYRVFPTKEELLKSL